MKLTIVGGGGFRVPLVYGALLERAERLGLAEVVLHDIDAARLERIAPVLEGLAAEHGDKLPFRTTTDLVDAVEDADYVFCAIRVGQLEGRVVDEDVPLGLGVLGQETTGPGGTVRRNYRSLVGVVAEDSLRQLRADMAFLGTSAVDPELGVWDTTMVEVPIKRLMIANSESVVLLADAAKFAMSGVVRICGPESLDHIVTDAPIPHASRATLAAASIEVTIA